MYKLLLKNKSLWNPKPILKSETNLGYLHYWSSTSDSKKKNGLTFLTFYFQLE